MSMHQMEKENNEDRYNRIDLIELIVLFIFIRWPTNDLSSCATSHFLRSSSFVNIGGEMKKLRMIFALCFFINNLEKRSSTSFVSDDDWWRATLIFIWVDSSLSAFCFTFVVFSDEKKKKTRWWFLSFLFPLRSFVRSLARSFTRL